MYFMPKYNLLQNSEDGASVADKIDVLRHDIFKITDAINKAEPSMHAVWKLNVIPGIV